MQPIRRLNYGVYNMKKNITKITLATIILGLSQTLCAFDGPAPAAAKAVVPAVVQPMITVISNDHVQFQIPKILAHYLTMQPLMKSEFKDQIITTIDYSRTPEGNYPDTLHTQAALNPFLEILSLITQDQNIEPLLLNLRIPNRLHMYALADHHYIQSILETKNKLLLTPDCLNMFTQDPTFIPDFDCFNRGFTTKYEQYFPQHELADHDDDITALATTPDGSIIVSTQEDCARIWRQQADGTYQSTILPSTPSADNYAFPEDIPTQPYYANHLLSIAISNDRALIAGGDTFCTRIWQQQADDTYQCQRIPVYINNDAGPLALSEDKSTIVCTDIGGGSDLIILKRQADGSYLKLIDNSDLQPRIDADIKNITISPDGARITTHDHTNMLTTFQQQDDGTYTIVRTEPSPIQLHDCLAITPDQSVFASHLSGSLRHMVINKRNTNSTYHAMQILEHDTDITTACITPDTSTIICACDDLSMHVLQKKRAHNLSLAQALLIKLINRSQRNLIDLNRFTHDNAQALQHVIASFEPGSDEARFVNEHIVRRERAPKRIAEKDKPTKRPHLDE